jgi:cysteinyl-tRNA synthetase
VLETYVALLKARSTESPVELPHADITSSLPLSKSLGLLEKMGEGFARAMDDDFNSREAVAKVLGAVREMMKTLTGDLDDADVDAFAHYAVDWLEETAGTVLGVLPTREMALAEPEADPRKEAIAEQVEGLLLKRTEARSSKDWASADQIRDELSELGVVVTDTPSGPTWDLA